MVLLRAKNNDGVIVDLDIFEADSPIRLDISAIENGTIGDVFGISSQTFSLPGTDKNNQFFGNLFDLGATPAVALKDSIDCQVLVDGSAVFTGKLYITDIVTDQRGYTTYQVALVNETIDFKFKLTDILMSELDWSAYTHPYTYGSITSSWDENLLSGSIIYPHVNYGIPEGNEDLPEFALAADDNSRTFDNSLYPLQIEQFKPAIKLRDVIDVIFSGSNELFPSSSLNYYYTSSFFESEYFNSLYMLTTANDQLGVATNNPNSGSFWAYASASQNFTASNLDYKVNFHAENFDTFNRFDTTGDYYSAYADGYYDFAIGLGFAVNNYDVNNRNRVVVQILESGSQAVKRSKLYVDPPQQGQLYVPMPSVYLTANTKVYVHVEWLSDDGSEQIFLGTGQDVTYFKGVGPAAVVGTNINLANVWPPDLRALDIIDGLIQKFNLVVEPVPNETNLLRIEPFDDWLNAGSQKDWSAKVDHSQRYKIVHPITEQPKFIEFRDENDEDEVNRYNTSNFGDTFGTYKYFNDSDLCDGTRTIGKTFAATPVKGIPNGESMIMPHLSRRDDNGKNRPFKFKPRLLHKNGKQLLPITATGQTSNPDPCYNYRATNNSGVNNLNISFTDCDGNATSSVVLPDTTIYVCAPSRPTQSGPSNQYSITNVGPCPTDPTGSIFPGYYWFEDEFGTIHQEQYWYQMTTFEYLPTDSNPSGSINDCKDLHFGNMRNPGWYKYFEPTGINGKTTEDAYHVYWERYINSLYDIDARKLTCNIYLEPWEIQDIALNDKIFIDGHYYRINRINGANIVRPDSVEVELIKIINANLKYPRRRINRPGDTPIDVTIDEISVDGSVNYISTDTGQVVTDAGVLTIAAAKDGFQVFPTTSTGSIVSWSNIVTPFQYQPSTQVFGSNNVDGNTNSLMVAGTNNTIGGQTSNLLVVGESNNVESGAKNSIALGSSHTTKTSAQNVQILGGSSHVAGNFTTDSQFLGGSGNIITGSSAATLVGGISNTIKDSVTSRSLILGGLNTTLSSSQDSVIINGDGGTYTGFNGNTLIGDFQSSNAAITGSDYRFNNTLVNGLYLEEDYYTNRHSYQVQAYSGSTDFAYSGDGLYKYIYEVDFDSAISGSGIGTIELPGIASQDQIGRTILFKASDNLSADNVVYIKSFGDTDAIEGTNKYVLERAGQWVELRASQYNESDSLITEWRVIRAGVPFESSVTNEGAYGSFYSTGSQSIATSGSAQLVTFSSTFASNLIALSGSAIELDYRGAYSFTWTAKVQNADNVVHYADFWVKYNGTDYPNSSVRAAIPARKSASEFTLQPVTIQLLDVALNNGDKIELYWRGDSTLLSLNYESFGGVIPAAPSIRATIHAV